MNNKKELCCNKCGGDNIEWQVWADEFNVVSDDDGTNEIYCSDCDEHHKSISKERKKLGKVKDLLESAVDDAQMFEFDIASGKMKKIRGYK